jgi:hypothetical protein
MAHILQKGDNPQNCNFGGEAKTKQDIQETFLVLQMKYLCYKYDIFILKAQIVNSGFFFVKYITSKFVSNET